VAQALRLPRATYADLAARLAAEVTDPQLRALWRRPVDAGHAGWDGIGFLLRLLRLTQSEAAAGTLADFTVTCRRGWEDLSPSPLRAGIHPILGRPARIAWCAGAAWASYKVRRFGDVRDWLLRPLADQWIVDKGEIELEVVPLLALVAYTEQDLPRVLREEALFALADFFRAAFGYSHAAADLVDLVAAWRPLAAEMALRCDSVGLAEEAVSMRLAMLAWSSVYDRDAVKSILLALEAAGNDSRLAAETRIAILIQRLDFTERSDRGIAADAALRRFAKDLVGHQRLQLLSAACPDAIVAVQRMPELLAAVQEHNAFLATANLAETPAGRELAVRHGRGRMFRILFPLVDMLLRAGNTAEATCLLSEWHFPGGRPPPEPVYLLHRVDGALWAAAGAVVGPAPGSDAAVAMMVPRLNDFLNLAITVRDEPAFTFTEPQGELGSRMNRQPMQWRRTCTNSSH